MRSIYLFMATLFLSSGIFAQNEVNFNADVNWLGYMIVSELPTNGGAYVFDSQWGFAELKATADSAANTITLQPNFNVYNESDPFWADSVNQVGNKNMLALSYFDLDPSYQGSDLTFKGTIASNTLDTNYKVQYYIKALDSLAGYSDVLAGAYVLDMPASGDFSVTVDGASLTSGLIIQCGFSVEGRNGNPANEATLGSMVITAQSTSTGLVSSEASTLRIYPNPAQNIVQIDTDEPIEYIRIFNLMGQEVKTINQLRSNSIDISDLEDGTYVIECCHGLNKRKTKEKFIKLN